MLIQKGGEQNYTRRWKRWQEKKDEIDSRKKAKRAELENLTMQEEKQTVSLEVALSRKPINFSGSGKKDKNPEAIEAREATTKSDNNPSPEPNHNKKEGELKNGGVVKLS